MGDILGVNGGRTTETPPETETPTLSTKNLEDVDATLSMDQITDTTGEGAGGPSTGGTTRSHPSIKDKFVLLMADVLKLVENLRINLTNAMKLELDQGKAKDSAAALRDEMNQEIAEATKIKNKSHSGKMVWVFLQMGEHPEIAEWMADGVPMNAIIDRLLEPKIEAIRAKYEPQIAQAEQAQADMRIGQKRLGGAMFDGDGEVSDEEQYLWEEEMKRWGDLSSSMIGVAGQRQESYDRINGTYS